MPLADEVMARYRSKKGGGGSDPESPAEDMAEGGEDKEEAKIVAGKALLAAIRRGDPLAVCEAVKNIADEY